MRGVARSDQQGPLGRRRPAAPPRYHLATLVVVVVVVVIVVVVVAICYCYRHLCVTRWLDFSLMIL